ncbi:biotin-dependent carboxyltransferase family protein [Aneurinibacillus danicus]|jgi:biotin-dependent carboxylase-like uncharacterized protein|uniref:Allophanate hydrolase n=1 Tax=Aneurinibacillus danicus TaxID=267746 RepID=A0A511V567_9BACL|nr:biotin-dependent carboxyltransferase family protein [Aneurinibacillus danicus]GEN33899.1 allophanate hydrolase [Aneurinibacillus danicus]
MLKILEPGLSTSVQDLGRFGYYHMGMPPSGALDRYSFQLGNLIVGNPYNTAALEITFIGPKIEFQQEMVIALTGAYVKPLVNGQEIPMWQAVRVREGDVISFTFTQGGARAYLCVAGGIDVPERLGSRSTYLLCQFGGYEGRKLEQGDILHTGNPRQSLNAIEGRALPEELWWKQNKPVELRVVTGLCSYKVQPDSLFNFLMEEWTVSTEADRVGYRYKGNSPLTFKDIPQPFGAGDNPSNVVDMGYPVGSIQVPNGEEPIILLNDAVTGGGYMTVATVISVDLPKVAQSLPGTPTRFLSVSIEQAMAARQEEQRKFRYAEEILASHQRYQTS